MSSNTQPCCCQTLQSTLCLAIILCAALYTSSATDAAETSLSGTRLGGAEAVAALHVRAWRKPQVLNHIKQKGSKCPLRPWRFATSQGGPMPTSTIHSVYRSTAATHISHHPLLQLKAAEAVSNALNTIGKHKTTHITSNNTLTYCFKHGPLALQASLPAAMEVPFQCSSTVSSCSFKLPEPT